MPSRSHSRWSTAWRSCGRSTRPAPSRSPSGSGAAVTLQVPGATRLELVTSNGPVAVRDISGGVETSTSNGPVTLDGVAGALAVETSNAPVTVSATDPVTLAVHTSNGGITFDGALLPGDTTLETSNGSVSSCACRLMLPSPSTPRPRTPMPTASSRSTVSPRTVSCRARSARLTRRPRPRSSSAPATVRSH